MGVCWGNGKLRCLGPYLHSLGHWLPESVNYFVYFFFRVRNDKIYLIYSFEEPG
jgi:hypothetical protein